MAIDKSLISNITDSHVKDVVVDIAKVVDNIALDQEKMIDDALARRGIDQEILGLNDQERAFLKVRKTAKKTREIWDNNGYVKGVSGRITYEDLANKDKERKAKWEKDNRMIDGVFSTDQPMMIPRIIEEMVREPVEPNMVLTNLLQNINVSNAGTTITFPAIGDAMVAADIAEGAEYPEASLEMAGQISAKIGKSGIAVKVTEEMVRYSMYDVIAMHIRAAGRGLMRHKERKAADLIFQNGVTVFDNTVSNKKTGGRAADGTANSVLTLDDILIMYADAANTGFLVDTMIIHPFAWFMFAREPVMREMFLAHGGGTYYQNFQGSIGTANAWGSGLVNNTVLSDPSQVATTFTVPSILPAPMRVIVTPYQEADLTNFTTTVTLADSSRLGLLLTDEQVSTDEFNDPMRDIRKIKFRERYAMALHDNGQAIRHAKNVNFMNKSYNFDALDWTAGTGALPTIDQTGINIVG